jgi:hypothetical protein
MDFTQTESHPIPRLPGPSMVSTALQALIPHPAETPATGWPGIPLMGGRTGMAKRTVQAGLALGLALAAPQIGLAPAEAGMLDTVKQNPALARKLCDEFKQLNASGQSATSKESIAKVAASQGLSQLDAEVLTTYVIGLHCPDVR